VNRSWVSMLFRCDPGEMASLTEDRRPHIHYRIEPLQDCQGKYRGFRQIRDIKRETDVSIFEPAKVQAVKGLCGTLFRV
jgi:hypothetical protein